MKKLLATTVAAALAASVAFAPIHSNAAAPAAHDIYPAARVLHEAEQQLSMIVIWMCIQIPGCAPAAFDPNELDIFKPSVQPELVAGWKKVLWIILI